MEGLRAFGRNEGGLNHAGDFTMLFAPIMDELSALAVYGPELCLPFNGRADSAEKITEILSELQPRLKELDICPIENKEYGIQYPRFYRPGFFPQLAEFVRDDWNTIMCFSEPYPQYDRLFEASYGYPPGKARFTGVQWTSEQQRKCAGDLGFAFLFQNIDACWWEVFSPRTESMARLVEHFEQNHIEYQRLTFERDYPVSATPVNRDFKDIHHIWPPKASPDGNERSK
jgi:hypothetical protein